MTLIPAPEILVDRILKLLPGLKTLRVLWSSDFESEDVSELTAAARARGVAVLSERIDDPAELPERVRAFAGKAEALWLMPDPALVNEQNFATLREYASAARVPFLGHDAVPDEDHVGGRDGDLGRVLPRHGARRGRRAEGAPARRREDGARPSRRPRRHRQRRVREGCGSFADRRKRRGPDRPMRLQAKVLLVALPLAAVFAGLTAFVGRRATETLMVRELGRRLQPQVEDFAAGLSRDWETRRESALLVRLQQAQAFAGAAFAEALSPDGTVVAHTNVLETGKRRDDPEAQLDGFKLTGYDPYPAIPFKVAV